MIIDKVVNGEPAEYLPAHLSFSKYVIDKLRECDDGVALINGETHEKITRKEFLYQVISLAKGLKKFGIKKGDVVALCSENRTEILVTAFAVLCCGGTVTTANTAYTDSELSHVLNISKPLMIFSSSSALKAHLAHFKKYKYIKHIVQYDNINLPAGVIAYSSLLEKDINVNDYEPEDVQGATDPALILYSSGTTGLPKGVMLSHLNFLYFTLLTSRNASDSKVYLTVVPWFHGYGLMTTPAYMLGGKTMVFMTTFKAQVYLENIQRYQIEVLLTVPPILLFLLKSPMVDKYDVSSVNEIWCAAAPLSRETAQLVRERFPKCHQVFQAYGMTETSLSVTIDRKGAKWKPGSGGAPLPGFKLKVVDIETRQLQGIGEKGEVCVKGPGVMLGYAGDAAATRESFDADGYLKTGDIGYYDEDGYFFIVDRLKEIVKYKGYQVPPAEVESAALQHPGVAEVGVAGAPHAACGELATAFVVRKPGATLTERELVDFVAQKLSPMKHLHGGVIFVEEIPKNPSGKILRRVLKQRLAARQRSKL